jgi:hypothetical protein
MEKPEGQRAPGWVGRWVLAVDGQVLGPAVDAFLEDDSGDVEWLVVELADGSRRLAPVAGAVETAEGVRLRCTVDSVVLCPQLFGPHADTEDERRLRAHYGLAPYSLAAVGSTPEPPNEHPRGTPAALIGGPQPDSSKAAAPEPAASEPAAPEPAASEPAAPEPAASEPAALEPAAPQPAASEPAAPEPAAPEPAAPRKVTAHDAGGGAAVLGVLMSAALSRGRWGARVSAAAGFAVGYLLGARAGRQRYETLLGTAEHLMHEPAVEQVSERVRSALGLAHPAPSTPAGSVPSVRPSATPGPGTTSEDDGVSVLSPFGSETLDLDRPEQATPVETVGETVIDLTAAAEARGRWAGQDKS